MTRVLSPRQVAERLGVSTRTLARWRVKKHGPRFFVVGTRTIFYPITEVEKFERGGTHGRHS